VLRGPNNRLTLALDGVYLTTSTTHHCYIQDHSIPYHFYKLFFGKPLNSEIADPWGKKWKKIYQDSCSNEIWELQK
jgi:hypothetical protein